MPAPSPSRQPSGSSPMPLPGDFDAPLAVSALEASGTGVCIADARRPRFPLVWANEAFTAATGYRRSEIETGSCRILHWPDAAGEELSAMLAALDGGSACEVTLNHPRPGAAVAASRVSFTPVHDADGVLTHLVGVQDTGAEDPLTGLPTRDVLTDRLGQAVGRLRRRAGTVAVLFVDFDGFKAVNDRLGHDAGDTFLCQAAQRLRAAVRVDDTVARMGGDEFVLLCEDAGGQAGAVRVAERVLQAFEEPVAIHEEEISLRVSVGIALAGSPDGSCEELLREADAAMYRAKERGGDGFAVYDSALRERANERVGLARDLRAAIGTEQLTLHYQPIVELGTERVVCLEALLRWQHPERGAVAPEEFIRVAEETGTIVELGRWVLERACTEFAAAIGDTGGRQVELAVNLSPRQLADADLPATVEQVLQGTGLAPGRLALEITETALTRDADAPADRLWALKRQGVRIVLDDFGSGYSSLGHLRRFPIDAIKIDRSFVAGMAPRSADAAIVGAILPMARALDLAVVAEGVETTGKGAHLYALGCRQAQGFLFGRPGPMAEVAPLVQASRAASGARPRHPELHRHQARFRAALAAGDAEQASSAVRDALAAGFDGVAVQAGVIGPALHHIGDEWELGRIRAADEHLATAISERALGMVFDAMGPEAHERRGRVLLAAVEGERHVLGLRMTADALRAGGHEVLYLGADVPEDFLLTAVDRHTPQSVCLTATLPAGARSLVATARRLRSRHPGLQVVAGGPGVPANALRRSGIEIAESAEHAVELIAGAQAAGAGQIRVSRLAAAGWA